MTLNQVVTLLGGGSVIIAGLTYIGKQIVAGIRWWGGRHARREDAEIAREKRKLDLEEKRIALAEKQADREGGAVQQLLQRIESVEQREENCQAKIEQEREARQRERQEDKERCQEELAARDERISKLEASVGNVKHNVRRLSEPHGIRIDDTGEFTPVRDHRRDVVDTTKTPGRVPPKRPSR